MFFLYRFSFSFLPYFTVFILAHYHESTSSPHIPFLACRDVLLQPDYPTLPCLHIPYYNSYHVLGILFGKEIGLRAADEMKCST